MAARSVCKGVSVIIRTLRLYSRVVVCEIRKIEVYYVDFSRPSPESKSGCVATSGREVHVYAAVREFDPVRAYGGGNTGQTLARGWSKRPRRTLTLALTLTLTLLNLALTLAP